MTYQEIKDDAIVLNNKATRIENGKEVTSLRLLRVIDEDEVKIVSETISSLKGDKLITELEFLLDNINISDSHIGIKTFLKNYFDTNKILIIDKNNNLYNFELKN